MCGITGIYSFRGNVSPESIKRMTDLLRHRGPDDEGFLAVNARLREAYPLVGNDSKVQGSSIDDFDKPVDLFLGHRRLAIIDLSAAGHQPMSNEDGSVWIVYNGEIYNYLEIGKELERLGHRLKSKADTEVMLHAYEEWGTDCLRRFNGMWAFAIVDLAKKRIFCSRDRAGEKPFYYVYDGNGFLFASEIKALVRLGEVRSHPNDRVIADYLFLGISDHTSETFFEGVSQLRPGEYLVIEDNRVMIQSYWDIEPKSKYYDREFEYVEHFYELFEDSIRLRLRSDAPIGSCLSGGLDSSSIVCLANRLMFDGQNIDPKLVGEKQKTFSSCFENPVYDERKFIEFVIRRTGAEKNYVFPNPAGLITDLTRLVWHQDEPFVSTSIYAQWRVMELAKERGIIVLLDGQGGDELLAGYPSSFYYLLSQSLKDAKILDLIKAVKQFRKSHLHFPNRFGMKMLAAILPTWIKPLGHQWLKGSTEWAEEGFAKKYLQRFPKPRKLDNDLNNFLYEIFRYTTLPGLLHYEDRNSMAFSIESRLPFLDYRLIEYLFSLPPDQKIAWGTTKVILRDAMKGILPEEVRNRSDKMGFATPEDVWFRTILRNPIGDIINSKSFADRGYFEINKVKEAFGEHCEGKTNISFMIWRWVNLELWFRTFVDKKPIMEN